MFAQIIGSDGINLALFNSEIPCVMQIMVFKIPCKLFNHVPS